MENLPENNPENKKLRGKELIKKKEEILEYLAKKSIELGSEIEKI